MERLTRSNSKNNGIGAKNYKTEKHEQPLKGISKNVKTATQKMKTTIKRHVIGSCSSITRAPGGSEVKTNSTLKRKANTNMQKESLNKINNRQTSAVSKVNSTSSHATASSSEKASKKKSGNSKRTGKIRKPNKKVDKTKNVNIKNAVKNDIQIPCCSTTNISHSPNSSDSSNIISRKAIANKWLKKRMEKEQLNKNITPEVKTRNSARDRLQKLRDRLSKEAETETNASGAEPKIIVPNVAVLIPFVNNKGAVRDQLRAKLPIPNPFVLRQPAINAQMEQLGFGRGPQESATNEEVEQFDFGWTTPEPDTNEEIELFEFGLRPRRLTSLLPESTDVQSSTSAQDQVTVFQGQLADDIDAIQSSNMQLRGYEDMDVDFDDSASVSPFVHSPCPQSDQRLVIVIDTNVFIHKLNIIKHIMSSYVIGFVEKPTVIVPWQVINELDALKDNRTRPTVQRLANDAMNYLYEMLPKQQWIQGQTLVEANKHLFKCEVPDDEILNCCLQQAAQGNSVILLSNDKNLCNKATINSIKNMSSSQIERKLEDRLFNYKPGELIYARLRIYKANMYNLLSTILKNEMERIYNDNWPLIININPPWTLIDVLNCILHHWFAVFDNVLPRMKSLITQLKNLLLKLDEKQMEALTDNQVGTFQGLCVEIAYKCQIIADYMDLAIATVNALKLSPHMDIETKELRQEKVLNDIFHNMYAYVSSFCAKVCEGLRIQHNLEDTIPTSESLDDLLMILPVFTGRTNCIIQTLLKALNADSDSVLPHLTRLNSVFAEVSEKFAFMNKCDMSPTYYFSKCRDRFLTEYKSYSVISELFKQCSLQVRNDILSRIM